METPNLDLETSEMQGILVRAYSYLSESCYVMIQFNDEAKGRDWISRILPRITPGSQRPDKFALQIAFTNEGIFKFLPEEKFHTAFSREFTEGMIESTRSRVLGDLNSNESARWHWGAKPKEIHAVLMLFAKDKGRLEQEYQEIESEFKSFEIKKIIRLDTSQPPDGKEHFGFRDGISQPLIQGLEKTDDKEMGPKAKKKESAGNDSTMPGEFILGYPNEYHKIPFSPTLKQGKMDFGKNGSYMVFRQLEQDVKAFWSFVYANTGDDPGHQDDKAIHLGSKMIGRWPNGNSLTTSESPNLAPEEKQNDFLFKENDKDGFRCPVGSHMRKSNPRDGIDTDPVVSLQVVRRHRILRRGRSYGPPLSTKMNPSEMLASINTNERGLYFICFNANIGRQFEFIQNTWNNNTKFDGLYNDIDPIMGYPFTEDHYTSGEFTIPNYPVRKKISNIPQFVYVRGGAYFFLPSMKSLKIISEPPTGS